MSQCDGKEHIPRQEETTIQLPLRHSAEAEIKIVEQFNVQVNRWWGQQFAKVKMAYSKQKKRRDRYSWHDLRRSSMRKSSIHLRSLFCFNALRKYPICAFASDVNFGVASEGGARDINRNVQFL